MLKQPKIILTLRLANREKLTKVTDSILGQAQ